MASDATQVVVCGGFFQNMGDSIVRIVNSEMINVYSALRIVYKPTEQFW